MIKPHQNYEADSEAESRDEVQELIDNDPYFSPENRQVRILAWGKAGTREVVL